MCALCVLVSFCVFAVFVSFIQSFIYLLMYVCLVVQIFDFVIYIIIVCCCFWGVRGAGIVLLAEREVERVRVCVCVKILVESLNFSKSEIEI